MSLKKEKKMFKTAPLPFQGQKRRFVSAFTLAINELKGKRDVSVIVDLFGGSGLLSHIAKRVFPNCMVVYNDFDNYSQRLQNIEATNILLNKIRSLIHNSPRGQKLNDIMKGEILDCIEVVDSKGYIDYITLSSSLLFSAKYVTSLGELRKESLYNNVKVSN